MTGGDNELVDVLISEPKGLANKRWLDLDQHVIVPHRITQPRLRPTGSRLAELDVLGHGAWTNDRLVELATTNWPQSDLFFHVPKMTSEFSVSEDDRKKLRDSGINTPVQLPTGFAFGPGLTTGGTSARIEAQINKLWNSIALDEERCSHSAIFEQVREELDYFPQNDVLV
jgi:hypothetical protein